MIMNKAEIIDELASRPGVHRRALENFLYSIDDLSYQEAVGNCELDARSYRWNLATVGAIREGILRLLDKGKSDSG